MSDEMILVPRYELLAWAEEWQYENDPGDGTDCITPFDTYLLKSPVVAQPDEHVEVLRGLTEVCRAAIKAGDWKVDGACDPDSLLQHAAAAIASLSAPQPPAEAQRCTCPSGDGSLRWPCPAHPPEAQPVYVGVDLEGGWIRATTPPSAPVGVAADILRIVDTAIDVCNDRDRPAMAEDLEAVRLYVEQASAALAQQPAAVDDLNAWRAAFVEERAARYREGGKSIEQARIHAETDAALMELTASQQGGEA